MITLNAVAPQPVTDFLADLVKIMARPSEAAALIEQYQQASADLRSATEASRAQQVSFAQAETDHKRRLDADRADAEAHIKSLQQDFDIKRISAENSLEARATRLATAEEKLAADVAANGELRANLERRLKLMQQAATAA